MSNVPTAPLRRTAVLLGTAGSQGPIGQTGAAGSVGPVGPSGSAAPVSPTPITATQTISPTVNTTYIVQNAAPCTITFSGTPIDGLKIKLIDGNRTFGTIPVYFASQAGGNVQNPAALAAAPSSPMQVTLSGASPEWMWVNALSTWVSMS